MEIVQRLPYSDHLVHLFKRCEELIPKSLVKRAVLVGATTGLVVYLITKKRYKLPPGPKGWPLIGNLLDFQDTTIYEKLIEWKAKYGPVISFHMGPVPVVTLNSADVILEALVKRQADFAGRQQSYSILLLTDGGKSIGFGDYNPSWKLHRKLAVKALRYYMSGLRLEQAVEWSLTKAFKVIEDKEGPFNPHTFTTLITFNIINSVCFSYACDVTDQYFINMTAIMDAFDNEVGNGFVEDFIPPLRLFPSKKLRRMISLQDQLTEYINNDISKHRETFSRDNIRDFCDAMLLAQEEAREEEDAELLSLITDGHITQTVIDMITAGFGTSRITLNWSLLYLGLNPDIQDKLHQEIDKALGARRIPKLSDRSNLPYTDAVLHEVMRISSLTPLALPHTTICDTKIGDYDVPKGTLVFINLYAAHHDPDYWKDPEVFKPERFLDENGQMASKPVSWLAFSVGRRGCLGESVAKAKLHLLLAGIMREFKVSVTSDVCFKLRGGSFTNTPNDFEIAVERRA